MIFKAEHLTASNGVFKDISFSVRSGEIVGFSGLMGAGRTEIMRGIFGLDPLSDGSITIEGNAKKIESPAKSIQNGIGFFTEDRKSEGLVLDFSVLDNISLPSIDGFVKNGVVDKKTEAEFAELLSVIYRGEINKKSYLLNGLEQDLKF